MLVIILLSTTKGIWFHSEEEILIMFREMQVGGGDSFL